MDKHNIFSFSKEELLEKSKDFLENAADKLDERFSERIGGTKFEAPLLEGEPELYTWYRIHLEEGLSADGSEYHIYMRKAESNKLCIFLSGGGLAWNAYTASHPITTGAILTYRPNFYYSNLRPVTELMNINSGIMENTKRNPFYDYNFIVITYATGDFHIGNHDYHYTDEEGNEKVLHFHGYANFKAAMHKAKQYFPHAEKLLFAGDSAGGFAVPALAEEVGNEWYANCEDITLLSDASLLVYDNWQKTICDLWHAKPEMYENLSSNNLPLAWYKNLMLKYPKRFRYLYCGSTHDYVLSTYYSSINEHIYKTDEEVQNIFYEQLSDMIFTLLEINPSFTVMIHDIHNPLTHGGTIHTAVRRNWFYTPVDNTTIARWLSEAVNGNGLNTGLELLHHK